jgi:hypothetical protein
MKADPEIDDLYSRLFVSIRGSFSNTMRRQGDCGFEKRADCGARRTFSDQEKLEVLGDRTLPTGIVIVSREPEAMSDRLVAATEPAFRA